MVVRIHFPKKNIFCQKESFCLYNVYGGYNSRTSEYYHKKGEKYKFVLFLNGGTNNGQKSVPEIFLFTNIHSTNIVH